MNRTRTTAAIVACSPILLASTLIAGTFHTIDFGSSFRDQNNGIIILDDSFDAVFAQEGIRFSSPTDNSIFWLGEDYGFSPAAFSLSMRDLSIGANSDQPLRVDFLTSVNFVSIQGIDGGGDVDRLTMRAFDSNNILIGQHSVTNNFGARQTVSITTNNIHHIVIEQTGSNHGVFLDNLWYNQVPAPSTLAVLALSLAYKRKR